MDDLERGQAWDCTSPRPDLSVLDLNMPVTDGHAFLQEAKPPDQFRSIPNVVLSVFAHSLDIQRSHHHCAGGSLIKPESFDDMKELTRVITACWKGTVTLPTVGDSGR